MHYKKLEFLAVALTATGVVAALTWPFFHEAAAIDRAGAGAQKVVTLTGLAAAGVWTDQEVRAADYWTGDPQPARPVLQVGEQTLLRLKSADVHHSFYSPELGIGPIDVKPGHVIEVHLTPENPGLFPYYCTTVCGESHFGMRGVIEVRQDDRPLPGSPLPTPGRYWMTPPPDPGASVVERGRWLFYSKGCVTCHGEEGQGGVPNFNYVDDEVPALHRTAANLFLRQPRHVEAVVDLIEQGISIEAFEGEIDIPRFFLVRAQYENVKELIRNGGVAGQKDVHGPLPPLQMPAWKHNLTDEEIDMLLAFILTLTDVESAG